MRVSRASLQFGEAVEIDVLQRGDAGKTQGEASLARRLFGAPAQLRAEHHVLGRQHQDLAHLMTVERLDRLARVITHFVLRLQFQDPDKLLDGAPDHSLLLEEHRLFEMVGGVERAEMDHLVRDAQRLVDPALLEVGHAQDVARVQAIGFLAQQPMGKLERLLVLRALQVQLTPSTSNVASSCDDNADICKRISPVFSSGPSWVQIPTCFIDSGPENSLLHSRPLSVTVAVSSHSPSTPA